MIILTAGIFALASAIAAKHDDSGTLAYYFFLASVLLAIAGVGHEFSQL